MEQPHKTLIRSENMCDIVCCLVMEGLEFHAKPVNERLDPLQTRWVLTMDVNDINKVPMMYRTLIIED